MMIRLHARLLALLLLLLVCGVPLSAQTTDRYENLPQSQSLEGFPQIGYPSALVDVRVYAAFDDPASGDFWAESSGELIQRVRNGEVRLTFVPLFVGTIPGGRGAARAAICAEEQQIFWQYADQLFASQSASGDSAFEGDLLLQGALNLGASQGLWSECNGADGPDIILNDAQRAVENEATFTATPYVLVNNSPSLTDSESLEFTIDLIVQDANNQLATQSAVEVTPEATEVDRYQVDALSHQAVEPPLTIALPDGWSFAYDALVLQDIDGIRPIPFAFYQGPVTGGTGTIVLLWGFPSLVNIGALEPDVWTDGTRLLRLAIFEAGCNVGTDLRRNYSVGGMQAVGTQFAAVDCPQLADTRGWFAGLRQFNVNFVFYAYAEPIEAMDSSAPDELQAILDSVQFVMPEITPEPTS